MARICILGGTGFVGQVLSCALVERGHQLRVLTRQHSRHRSLLVLPTLELVQADIHDKHALLRHTEGMDVIINLVGILNESRRRQQTFRTAHVELAASLVGVCRTHHIPRLLQVSALGANRNALSHYLRSKAEAETTLFTLTGSTHVTCFRPSVIFGPRDHFINRFATLLRLAPYYFPLACPDTRFAPVYVHDVVDRLCDSLDDRHTYRQTLSLCGPDIYTLKELVEMTAQMAGLRRKVIGLSPGWSRLQARVLGMVPGKPFTLDNYRSMQTDSVCEDTPPCATHLKPIMHQMLARR